MASRAMPTRSRTTTRSKSNDENAPTSSSAGNGLRGKPSVGNMAGAAKKASTNAVVQVATGAVKIGAKRPALGNISNSTKDPHVDTDIPMKASKMAGATRSRSGSLTANEPASKAAKGSKVQTATRVPLGASQSVNGVNTTSTTTTRTSQTARPTARLPRGTTASRSANVVASTDDDRASVAPTAPSEDVQMEETARVKASGSGLTPAIGDITVKQRDHELSDVPEVFLEAEMMSDMNNDFDDEDLESLYDEGDHFAVTAEEERQALKTLQRVRETFEDDVDELDTTMVAEYAEDIFAYMSRLEDQAMPNPRYVEHQLEITWEMRTTLVDWLLQVHLRYHMLPETLWIAVNIVDRFLSARTVSLIKLQLVGVTAMFIAAKYEEILAPSVDEFVYMTENGYTKEEILKGERIILQTLDFDVSSYCSPYSWVRRISKADDYDIQTRTLSKFLMEVTLLDYRFIRAKPSFIAAVGMYIARRMLDGDWNDAFVYYSDFTEVQVYRAAHMLLSTIGSAEFDKQYVYKKYSNKKFLRASTFARDWVRGRSNQYGLVGFKPLSS